MSAAKAGLLVVGIDPGTVEGAWAIRYATPDGKVETRGTGLVLTREHVPEKNKPNIEAIGGEYYSAIAFGIGAARPSEDYRLFVCVEGIEYLGAKTHQITSVHVRSLAFYIAGIFAYYRPDGRILSVASRIVIPGDWREELTGSRNAKALDIEAALRVARKVDTAKLGEGITRKDKREHILDAVGVAEWGISRKRLIEQTIADRNPLPVV